MFFAVSTVNWKSEMSSPAPPVKKPSRDQFGRIKEYKMTERQWVEYIIERNRRAANIAAIRRKREP